jgi:hypothetical protein
MNKFDENLLQGLPLIYECGGVIIIGKNGKSYRVVDEYFDKIIKEKEAENGKQR